MMYKDKSKQKKQHRAYYLANAKHLIERSRAYYSQHKEDVIKRQNLYYKDNHAKCLQAMVIYRKKNKDIMFKKRRTAPERFSTARSCARQHKKEWALSLPEYASVISKPCHYCGKTLLNDTGSGLDRIRNEFGYIVDNVLPCCGCCNRVRSNYFTVIEMEQIGKVLMQINNNRLEELHGCSSKG